MAMEIILHYTYTCLVMPVQGSTQTIWKITATQCHFCSFLLRFVVTIKSLSKTFDIKILFGKAFTDCGNSYGHLGCSSGSINYMNPLIEKYVYAVSGVDLCQVPTSNHGQCHMSYFFFNINQFILIVYS